MCVYIYTHIKHICIYIHTHTHIMVRSSVFPKTLAAGDSGSPKAPGPEFPGRNPAGLLRPGPASQVKFLRGPQGGPDLTGEVRRKETVETMAMKIMKHV